MHEASYSKEKVKAHFSKFVTMPADDMESFLSLLEHKIYPKKSIILNVGETESKLRFVLSGVIRFFYLKNDLDITAHIGLSDDFSSAYGSFTSQEPSLEGIEALSEVECFEMSFESLQMLYGHSKEGERMGRLSAETVLQIYEKRLHSFMTKTALERYEELYHTEPVLLQMIPQKYVAEYLGIKPESLSRLKKEIS